MNDAEIRFSSSARRSLRPALLLLWMCIKGWRRDAIVEFVSWVDVK